MKNKESDNVPNSSSVENDNKSVCKATSEECDEVSSSDSVLEIRLNEFVRSSEISDFDVRALVIRCSSCGQQIYYSSNKEAKKHRKLGVITCKECYDFYGSSEFSQDESGYNYCTWCGNGGKLIVCDYCPNGFCSMCIRRNFGRAEISETTKEGWKCYCCDRSRLKPKVKFCNFVLNSQAKNVKKERKPVMQTKNNLSEEWLQVAFNESDEACKKFHKKMAKLKSIGITKSKSLKHIVKKMEKVINNHKVDLKNIVTSLSNNFASHIEFQSKAEEQESTKNTGTSLKIVEKSDNAVDEETTDDICIVHDNTLPEKNSSDDKLSDSSLSILQTVDDISKSKEEKIQAKLKLLKSSSESDCDDKAQPVDAVSSTDIDNQCKEQKNVKAENVDILKNNISNKGQSDIESIANDINTTKSKVRKKLNFSFSESSDSDFHTDKPNIDEIEEDLEEKLQKESTEEKLQKENTEEKLQKENTDEKLQKENTDKKLQKENTEEKLQKENTEEKLQKENIGETLQKENTEVKLQKENTEEKFAESDSEKQLQIDNSSKILDPETDPKLKLQTEVGLIRCDHLLKDGETYLKLSDDSDAEAKLDKLVNSLCKFPKNRKSKTQGKPKTSKLTKAAAKQLLLESSSSISLSSGEEEEEDEKRITIAKKFPIKKNFLTASNLVEQLDSRSSSTLSSGSDVEEEKKIKKSKSARKANGSDSSDDFVPVKKRKYDKLLHAPLFSDDEKKPKERKDKKKGSKKRKVMSSEEEKKNKKSDKSSTSESSSEDDNQKKKKQPKKRRRIKTLGSSSDEEKDDSKEPNLDGSTGKGRKNIRKIVSQKKLADATKEAQLEEKERRKRIQERQRLYNKIEDASMDGREIITRKFVLEVDQESKEEIVEIHPDLVCKLKPHQVNGVKFMWECTIETVKDLDKPGSGCILAHCMGLGKTLQVIAFLHTCLTNPIVSKKITRGMIICPYNTTLNWASEFDYWLDDVENDIKIHQLTAVKSNFERMEILKYWFTEGGVVILSYDIFRRLSTERIPKLKPKQRKQVYEYLLDPGPDIVVCDEGHVLKNEKSAISVATSKLRTRRRIVLTGTPLQNNLSEYHCMLSFVKPNLLGNAKEFRNRFVNPIINGQYDDSNDHDVKLMKKRIHILHKLLEGCVQRCDYSALTKFLPPKHEFVISVKLSEVQMKMYECYLEKLTTAKRDMKAVGSTLFIDFNNLRCIWTHPYICHVSYKRAEYKKFLEEDEEEDEEFINDESESTASEPSDSTTDDDKLLEKIENDRKKDYRTRSKANEVSDHDESNEEIQEGSKQWYHEFISDDDKYNIELSGKMVLLLEILKECEIIGDKLILFSQSLLALDAIEDILVYSSSLPVDEDNKMQDATGRWIKGVDYFRMDGTTSAGFRKSYIDMFNDPSQDRARLFLISTRAGSLGTNLVGANRVVIFDTSWNPSHDVQAIFRVYRFGQIKPVYVYRLLAQGTMEEKIYDRQVTKQSLSCRVVDEQQIDRHFSAADLAELYTFDRNYTAQRPTPMVPKDRLLAELLIRKKDWIVTYHEHDSLLQNQTEEDLTEEERQAAWTEYENEREGRMQAPSSQIDFNTLTSEPDFSKDYEGRIIPDLKSIIENLYDRLKTEMPNVVNTLEFKKKLLGSVYAVRQAFQEKHVKVLRLKQEYCTRGTVPNSLNKYMDELSQVLKSTGDYITKLSGVITYEQMKTMQQNPQFVQQTQNIGRGRPPTIFIGKRFPGQTQQPAFAARFSINTQRPTFYVYGNKTYVRSQQQPTQKQPTITEVDDNSSNPATESNSQSNNSSKKSTVIIEEIS